MLCESSWCPNVCAALCDTAAVVQSNSWNQAVG